MPSGFALSAAEEARLKTHVVCLAGLLVLINVTCYCQMLMEPLQWWAPVAIATTGVMLLGLAVNWGVRKLRARTRLPLVIVSVLCAALFPFGTLLGVAIVRQVTTGDDPRLLTREYEALVRATPHLERRPVR